MVQAIVPPSSKRKLEAEPPVPYFMTVSQAMTLLGVLGMTA